ncbi:hypothetical protein VTN00DRAFT_10407 [Thermoascus crustaceus]|uniref:uncharacterized protein n=1 Tax=Thermoascus crustaceus TaxID=5088 RepID=UPI00374226E0
MLFCGLQLVLRSFTVAAHVVRNAKIIVSTNNNIALPIIATDFGHDAKSIILFRDEDSKELEVNNWITVCKLAHGDNITGIVMSGDIEQLRPTVLSAGEEPGFNEFALQMRTSLTKRLLHMRHPIFKLREQRRC